MYKSVHGGDIYSEQNNSLGKNIVDYSANVNPLGLPVSVKEAIKNSIFATGTIIYEIICWIAIRI